MTVDDLKEMFGVKDDQELGPIFGRKKGAVSVWRRSGVPASIERDAKRMLGKSFEEKEKAEAPLIVQAIIGKVQALSESEQAEAFRILAERFPDEQRTEKR